MEFGVAWVQEDPAQLWLLCPAKFRISKELSPFSFPVNFVDLLMSSWLQADPSHLLHHPKEILNVSP
jgi:hypothetical protein